MELEGALLEEIEVGTGLLKELQEGGRGGGGSWRSRREGGGGGALLELEGALLVELHGPFLKGLLLKLKRILLEEVQRRGGIVRRGGRQPGFEVCIALGDGQRHCWSCRGDSIVKRWRW